MRRIFIALVEGPRDYIESISDCPFLKRGYRSMGKLFTLSSTSCNRVSICSLFNTVFQSQIFNSPCRVELRTWSNLQNFPTRLTKIG